MTDLPELPGGGEWAIEPLVDKANVGRYVVVVNHSGRRGPVVMPIRKVGRINIAVANEWGTGTTTYRVHPIRRSVAHGQFSAEVQTAQWFAEAGERNALIDKIRRTSWSNVPLATLRAVGDAIGEGR